MLFAITCIDRPGHLDLRLDTRAAHLDHLNGLGDDLLHGGLLVNPFDGAAARAYRMYEATLGRTPDHAGHLGWIARLNNGMSAEQAAGHFVGSAEFTQRYGALDNGAFVSQLYVNVLNRQADSAGLNAWVAQLNAGASRAQVVLGFSESAEFVGRTGPEALRYSYAGYQESFADDVFRLYRATLARDPDAAGLEGWAGQLAGGRAQAQVAAGFVASAEFQQTYGNTSDSQFINLLYQNVLGRGADGAGLQGWQDRLNGGWSRADVVLGFAQSTEFVRATGAALKGWMRSQGTDDVLAGNGGQDVLFGGLWADEFHFDRGDTGRAVVVDLEGWDRVKLSGFGYASASEARSHMNQSGSDVVFTDQGTTAVFLNTQLAQIADDMILTA